MKKIKKPFFSIGCIIILTIVINNKIFPQGIWTLQNSGTSKALNSIFFLNSTTGFAAGDSGIIIKTTNGGLNWIPIITGTTNSIECVQFLNPQTGYATGGQKFYSTTNGGNNWQSTTMTSTSSIHSLFFVNDSTGYIAGSAYYFFQKTSNYGINWNNIPMYATIDGNNCVHFINSITGFVTCYYVNPVSPYNTSGAVSRTTNSGNNWTWYYALPQQTWKVHFGNSINGMCVGSSKLARTSNTGTSWSEITIPSGTYRDVFMTNATNAYLAGYGSKIYKTTDFGNNWINASYSGTANLLSIYFINDTVGFICGSNGTILKTITGGISPVLQGQSSIPEKFQMFQNYPNPFNPNTKISYQVASSKLIKLIVYDVLGKEVVTLVNEKQSPGTYEVPFSISQFSDIRLSSGIYFYSLYADGVRVDTKRMVLLK